MVRARSNESPMVEGRSAVRATAMARGQPAVQRQARGLCARRSHGLDCTRKKHHLGSPPVFRCRDIGDGFENAVTVVRACELIVEVPPIEYALDLHRLAIEHRAPLKTVPAQPRQQIQNLAPPSRIFGRIAMALPRPKLVGRRSASHEASALMT